MNDRDKAQKPQPDTGSTENQNLERTEQFNELSELSLEERMNVADQIGVPRNNMEDAVASGTIRGYDESETGRNDEIEEETETTDR